MQQIYLTNEQVQRLAALACDNLYGFQISSTCDMDSFCIVDFSDIDNTHESRHARIESDGSWVETT